VFFFPQFCDVCDGSYHPQGDLAMFGYRPAMKVKFIEILLYLSYFIETCVEAWQFFIISNFLAISFLRRGIFNKV
jgi:hypothetical protein